MPAERCRADDGEDQQDGELEGRALVAGFARAVHLRKGVDDDQYVRSGKASNEEDLREVCPYEWKVSGHDH